MKMAPCAIHIHPPCIHIHSCTASDAGCQAEPDPSCGEGREAACSSIRMPGIGIPCSEGRGFPCASPRAAKNKMHNRIFFTGTLIAECKKAQAGAKARKGNKQTDF